MDAKEYLKKVSKICKVYREDYCNGCPLGDLFCVIPIYFKNEEEEEVIDRVVKEVIDRVVKLVEYYKLNEGMEDDIRNQ